MAIVLFVMAGFCVLAAAGLFEQAKSAIHEIEAMMFIVCSAVLFVGAAVVEAIVQIRKVVGRLKVEETKKG